MMRGDSEGSGKMIGAMDYKVMKMYNQAFIVIFLLLTTTLSLDYQKQIEYEHALNYIIGLAEEGRLSSFEE